MSFQRTEHVKRTRKVKRCRWCNERINPGDPSVVVSGLFEGDFYYCRYHPECEDAIERYCKINRAWGEELPDETMNRGGIMPYGESEPCAECEGKGYRDEKTSNFPGVLRCLDCNGTGKTTPEPEEKE